MRPASRCQQACSGASSAVMISKHPCQLDSYIDPTFSSPHHNLPSQLHRKRVFNASPRSTDCQSVSKHTQSTNSNKYRKSILVYNHYNGTSYPAQALEMRGRAQETNN